MDFGVGDPGEKRIRVLGLEPRDGLLACSCEGRLESAALEASRGSSGSGLLQYSLEADHVSSARSASRRALGGPGSPDSDLGPPTPLAGKENVEEDLLVSPSFEQEKGAAGSVTECLTPSEAVFDPFAPAAEELIFAPKKRVLLPPRESLRRELKFDLCYEEKSASSVDKLAAAAAAEEDILELLYTSFLDVIVRNQAMQSFDGTSLRESLNFSVGVGVETTATMLSVLSAESGDEILKEELIFDDAALKTPSPPPALPMPHCGGFLEEKLLNDKLDCSDGLKTPTALPLLSGIADTCPAAPMRPASKSRKISSMGICRKLEF